MTPYASDQNRKPPVWTWPYILVLVMGFPILGFSCNHSGDTTLAELAVIVGGHDQITFNTDLRYYDAWLPVSANAALVRALPTDPGAQVWIRVDAPSEAWSAMVARIGGGEVTVPMEPGLTMLRVSVKAPGGASDYYTVGIQIGCSQCDDGLDCTTDTCNVAVEMCVHTPITDGGGCDFDGGSTVESLRVLEVTPPSEAQDVQLSTIIAAQLDAEVDGQSLTESSLRVRSSQGDPVPGETSLDPLLKTVQFTPSSPLSLLTSYTATLVAGLQSTTGGTLESDHEWSFTTRDGRWGQPEALDDMPGGVPRIFARSGGHILTVWSVYSYGQPGIGVRSRWYSATSGWSPVEGSEVVDDGILGPDRLEVSMDADGNAVAVWRSYDSSFDVYHLYASLYTNGQGWSLPELVATLAPTNALCLQAAIVRGQGAIVLFCAESTYASPRNDEIWYRRYVPEQGWQAPELIADGATAPSLALDVSGNVIAAWVSFRVSGFPAGVVFSQYDPTSAWTAPVTIAQDRDVGSEHIDLEATPEGGAVLLYGGPIPNLHVSHYTPSSGWGAPIEITDAPPGTAVGSNPSGQSRIAVGPRGHMFAAWMQADPETYLGSPWFNRYTPGVGWGIPEPIETAGNGHSGDPIIAVDAEGNAIAVWDEADEPGTLFTLSTWGNRYVSGEGWGVPERIESYDYNFAGGTNKHVVFDDHGRAHAVWPLEINRFE